MKAAKSTLGKMLGHNWQHPDEYPDLVHLDGAVYRDSPAYRAALAKQKADAK